MKHLLSKKPTCLAVYCALVASVVSGGVWSQTNPEEAAYLSDQRGTVVRSGTGLCWHTGFGPATPTPECDPLPTQERLAKAEEPPVLPSAVSAPASERLSFGAEALFAFDKADLLPVGRLALDDFVGKMNRIGPETITVDGHTDRFGTEDYNQSLSERRAQSVKAYLVSQGIDATRIRAEGHGEKQPVTKNGECGGNRNIKVTACLQPDRRVEVEVTGGAVPR